MPDIRAPHPGRAVDQLAALVVMHIDPFARPQHAARLRADRARRRPGLDQVINRVLRGLLVQMDGRVGHDASFLKDMRGA